MQQLPLIETGVIRCRECGDELKDLADLRQPCAKTGRIHLVSASDHNALYRKTFKVVMA